MREHHNQSDNLETVISLSKLEENTNIQGKIMKIWVKQFVHQYK